jgi:hypothetical protein
MRPLGPDPFVIQFRLIDDGGGILKAADSLF